MRQNMAESTGKAFRSMYAERHAIAGAKALDDHEWKAAEEEFRIAMEMFEQVGDERKASDMLSAMALCRYMAGNKEGAKEALEKAMKIKRAFGDVEGEATDLLCLGDVCLGLENIERAIECYTSARDKFEEKGVPDGVASACEHLAMVEKLKAKKKDVGTEARPAH
jgi:tetratricopeptide (TPR) repeat protein